MVFKPQVTKAQRIACKASIMLEGLPGEGKSGLALCLAYGLVGEDWNKVGMIDCENNSARLFVGTHSTFSVPFGEFLLTELDKITGFSPTNYLYCKEALVNHGAKAVIKDSITHAWLYQGGVLSLVQEAKKKSSHYNKDQYAAWGDDDVVREKNELLSLIRDAKIHIITTVRVKEKFEYVPGEEKYTLKSLGEQQIQQADLKYEPDLVLHMLEAGSSDGNIMIHPKAKVTKSRYAILKKNQTYEFTPTLIKQLREYLEEGTSPDELLEKQRQDYIVAVTEHLNSTPSAVPIWKVMKQDVGHETTKLEDMPLDVIKTLFIKLTS